MRDEKLVKLEEDLQKVPGVRDARVVGVDTPAEIHIVATGVRAPKQVVRDVQSLASAGYGLPIDHRIVSVVQLDEAASETPKVTAPSDKRPALDSVVFASKADGGWVRVRLKWTDGEMTEGLGRFGSDREGRAEGAASALIQALAPRLGLAAVKVKLDEVALQRTKTSDVVVVQCTLAQNGSSFGVVGSSLVIDDVATAAVHAALQGLNRKLSRLTP